MARIEIIGLGAGHTDELSPTHWARMKKMGKVYMRTMDFPLVPLLIKAGIAVHSFDDVYEAHTQFADVYAEITERLLALAKQESEILYAVPGHPRVAERTVSLLLTAAQAEGVCVDVSGGHSFLDHVFAAFAFDPIEGFLLLDATSLEDKHLSPSLHTVVAQVYDRFTAADVKLTLMQTYPDTYEVFVGSYLGTDRQVIRTLPLYELDRSDAWDNFSLLYVPPATEERVHYRQFSHVVAIVKTLRSPEGCPWDREQTHESIRKNLIEETYEVLQAIDTGDIDNLQEELGDLLLQILLHSEMTAEVGYFDVYDVIGTLSEKLIRRHPHVFGENKANDAFEALQNWQEMKKREKAAKGEVEHTSVLSGIPKDLPAVLTAYKLQKKAAAVGFDWTSIHDVLRKVEEEWQELSEATDSEHRLEEYGDLLFALVNVARFMQIDPEEAIAKANIKFTQRFHFIEEQLRVKNKEWSDTNLEEMEEMWQAAKKI